MPKELDGMLNGDHPPLVLDVREPEEHATARINPCTLIPLGQLHARMNEIQGWKESQVVVYCHHGMRSRHACQMLDQSGFRNTLNLEGGIDLWSVEIDPKTPRY